MARINFGPLYCLCFRAHSGSRSYEVSLTYTGPDGATDTVRYVVSKRLVSRAGNGMFICELAREAVTLNRQAAESPLGNLAESCGALFSPLLLRLYTSGGVVGLEKPGRLAERWAALEPQLREYYTGDATEAYLAAMSAVVKSPDALCKRFCDSLLFETLFCPVYGAYPDGTPRPASLNFQILPGCPPVQYACTITVETDLEPDGAVVVALQGVCSDPRNAGEITAGFESPTGAPASEPHLQAAGGVHFRFVLSPEDKMLRALSGVIFLQRTEGGDEIDDEWLASVEVSIRHLPERDTAGTNYMSAIVDDQKKRSDPWWVF